MRVRVLARDYTTERPLPAMCGPLSLVCCMFAQLPIRDAQLDCARTTAAGGMRVRYDGDRANRI